MSLGLSIPWTAPVTIRASVHVRNSNLSLLNLLWTLLSRGVEDLQSIIRTVFLSTVFTVSAGLGVCVRCYALREIHQQPLSPISSSCALRLPLLQRRSH